MDALLMLLSYIIILILGISIGWYCCSAKDYIDVTNTDSDDLSVTFKLEDTQKKTLPKKKAKYMDFSSEDTI